MNNSSAWRKLQRRFKARVGGDNEGTLATLLTARRLVQDGTCVGVYNALNHAVVQAKPADQGRAYWKALSALTGALEEDVPLSEFSATRPAEDIVALFDSAAKNQGAANVAAKKLTKFAKKGDDGEV